MWTRTGARTCCVFILLVLGSHLINVAESSKVWGEVPFPGDLEAASVPRHQRYLEDDEDFANDEASGYSISGEEDGSTPEPPVADLTTIYYRALVNFTDSFTYGPELDDIDSATFQEISAAIVDTLESEYFRIPGTQMVNVVLIKQIGKDVFVELDVGSEDNSNESQIRGVLFSVVSDGSIASYVTSVRGFEFRRLGELKPSPPVPCSSDEFTCRTGVCIPLSFVCDNRPDCLDMSDEINCTVPATPPPIPIPRTTAEIKTPPRPGPCRADQFTCQNGQCVSQDYVCDGDTDCRDGSDEQKCGTPSPCEPNEFKCRNGRCALKLWRCDGDNDCHDNSDEIDCPAKKPGDVCAPEQFRCLSDQTCIPASYQCDEEPDCPDRSDEYACAAPVVTSPPEQSITASRGQTVTFTCTAMGMPIPIITWRLNWGHIPSSNRITMTSENGHGTLTVRDVKEGDQGAYTCEAINAKGLVFAIPDGVLTLSRVPSNCPEGHFNVGSRCVPCFCAGITKNCQSTGRYRSQISLRFTEEENFKGANVSFPSRPGTPPPLSSTQMIVNPDVEEFQLVDLSRRFLDLESYWTLPRQFLGSKVDSYGGYLRYQVSYLLQREGSEPVDKPDVVLRGNGNRLLYRRGSPTIPNVKNQREIKFTEENWQHSSGQPVSRTDLLMTLANLESISIRTVYNNRMASVGLSDIVMDTTTAVFSLDGQPRDVEECRCPPGYSGLSCESCTSGFERVPGSPYLGTCAGCNCHNHASACDPVSGHCLSCQHNTEGPQCDKCRPGYFGDPSRGRPDDCKPCPCPYTETSRRFSDTCFLDVDSQATCDACAPGYTGRRCEKCASGYVGNPLQPSGKCIPYSEDYTRCDNKGTISSSSRPCNCKANVAGALCDECKPGTFHLSAGNPEGCLQCFCMGVTKECASSTWTRDQVRGGVNGQLFSLLNEGSTRTITEDITQRGGSEIVYRLFANIPNDIYYWVLPESFRGDKVTAYGGELRYRVRYETHGRSVVIENKPDVVLQGNSIFLEHYTQTKTLPRVPTTVVVPFRESAWRRADGQPCTREHLLMALADVSVFMIRATYADKMAESSVGDIQMDIAVPHSSGNERALEVEECACPQGYRGPSCQDCDVGYTRTGSGLYLGTCEKCECHGHASSCDSETGACLQCQHNTAGPRCERCQVSFYGDPVTGGIHACRPCPCFGPTSGSSETKSCYLDRDGQPTCNCPVGYTGRRCEGCSPGYTGNPERGQFCTPESGRCQNCDQRGSEGCSSDGNCRCKMNVESPSCSICKPGTFNLSPANKDGCMPCFCMGVTQKCFSSSLYRDWITTVFAPGNAQGFALVNRQRTNRISNGFSVELSTDGTQLSFTNFEHHSQEPHFWQLPSSYQGDKTSSNDVRKLDEEIWALIGNFSQGPPASLFSSSSSSTSSVPVRTSSSVDRSGAHASIPSLLPSGLQSSVWASGPHPGAPGHSPHLIPVKDKLRKNTVEPANAAPPGSSNKYSLVYKGFNLHSDDVLFWKLPERFHGDQVQAYGGKLKYTISYVPGPRGAPIEDVDIQIIGNDITLVARQDWRRGQGTRETRQFEFVFREEYWQRPDGMPATREHLLMVLADLDDILIRASYHTVMRSSSISGVRMETAVTDFTGLERAVDVEQCYCPPGYRGLSCQDCALGYTRTGGGLYLGHCELCECNGHSDSCHPETGICTSCQHNTMGELCEQCAAGFFGDASAGTPEDCQPCACPHTDPENQFSPTCESLGNGDYQCTACQPGYTGQYCERCAPGYVGNPQQREKCRPYNAASLVVKVYPERVQVSQGSSVTLRCQASGPPPHYFYWTRDDGRPISSSADRRRQGEELHFSTVLPSDAGIYTCTCRNQLNTNRSRAEIIVTTSPSKPIEVFIEEPKRQRVNPGATANFICTAKSQFKAYTLVWTRRGNGKLPDRAMDFNGILTIQNVRPEDAGEYVCTGSNMEAVDEGTAHLLVQDGTKAEMFYTAYEMFEGHRQPGEVMKPKVTILPTVLKVQQGQRAEFRCTAIGSPAPSIEWTGGPGNRISSRAIIQGGVLSFPSVQRSDEGEYTCRAVNTQGEHTARAVLYVYSSSAGEVVKPTVTINQSVLRAQEGTRVEFRCTATGNPAPSIEWTGDPGNRISGSAVIRGGVLSFPSVQRSDEGEYTCRAVNTQGEHTARAFLYVYSSPAGEVVKPTVTINQSVLRAQEGTRVEFRCTATGNPAPSIEWTGGPGNRISGSAVIRGGVLTLPSVQRSDEGEYTCRAVNTQGEHTARAFLYVYSSPAAEVVKPTVTIHPSVLRAQEGTQVEFRCTATGNPAPSIEWTGGPGNRISGSAVIRGGVLTLPSVQRSDEGEYTCRAVNTQGEYTARAFLYVYSSPAGEVVKPTVTINQSVLRAQEGTRVEFRCTATGNPAPSIEWTGGPGNRISGSAVIRGGVLSFPSVQRSDEGEYTCRAVNIHGEHTARAFLYVYSSPAGEVVKPTVTIHPSVLRAQEGTRVEFRCTATGNPAPSIEWTGGPGNRISGSAVIRGGVLTFPSVQRSDEGEYTCRAINIHGEHTARAVLSLQSASLPHVQVSPQRVEIHEDETLRLYCRAGGSPSPVLTWKKRGGSLPPQAIPSHGFHQFKSNNLDALQRRIDEMQARMDRTDYGTLIIPDMKISDAGTYLCIGTNAVGSSEEVIDVTVIKSETVHSDITIQSTTSTVVQGETLELNCVVQGNPPPPVIWSRPNGLGLSSNHQVIGSKLRIVQASPDDTGEYICRVYGGPSTRQATVYVSVTTEAVRHQSPIISIEPHSVIVKKGESASFKCRLHTGAQPVHLEWKLSNNEPLHDNVKVSEDGAVLTISSAQPGNQGAYRCVARNLYGITHSIASLIVRELPKATVTPSGPVRVNVGEPINLECQAAGEPRPSVTWHRLDNNRRTIMSSPVPMESNALMQILVARPEDSGIYICTAQNSQGKSETRVEVTVHGGAKVPTAPLAFVQEPLLVVVEGATTVLHCDAHGFPKPTITWSKLRAPLPWGHKIVNNSLVLPSVGRQDSGQYICNATNNLGTSEVTIMVDVETPPYTTTVPDDVAVRVGEVIRLQCLAHGTPPMRFEWSKVDGRLPAQASVQGGDLQINLASSNDAGTYKCVAINKVGRSEAVAKVSVRSSLSVRVSPQVEVKALGSAVEFTCSASGGPEITLEWLKEGGPLPHNHHIKDGVLRIENLEKSNEGMYICRATTLFGQAQDTAKLTIQALPKVMINVRTSVQTVTVGTSVEFECHAEGDPVPTVRWSKVGAPLPDHVQVKGPMLRIERVTEVDAGQYRCTATNNVGSVQSQVVLKIQSLPQIAAQPDTKEVAVGSTAIFPCIATGYPVPNITWSKLENELPPKCTQDAHVLTVPDVTHEDSGTYVCTASNKQGKVQAFTKLDVHERVMPYFSQEPLSYLKLPTIKNSYKAFKINITFKPDNVDGLVLYSGMILYNGQKKTMGADFISLGLVGGRPEFRFDVGSGMATIRYPTAIKLGEFHTVQLYRNGTQGSITVDGEAPINGTSQGKFQGLDLNEELFVGGYPNYSMIARTAELKSGFVGCIKQLIIQGDEVIFKDLDRSSSGVTNCPTCKDYPCQNGGVCRDSKASLYKCSCPRGFTGSNCQHLSSEHCHPEACGPDATCINRPNGVGYDCRCHLGKYGHKCMEGTLVTTPLFNSDESYIAYPPLTNIHNDLRIDMEFKPMDEDGMMFFIGGKKMKVEDFVTLSLVDGYVEFRYELGTGQAILRSQEQVSIGQWHHVTAERINQDGLLKLDDAPEVRRSSPGKAQGLNVYTPMYLGGVPTKDILPKPANVSMFFEGCVGEVSINGKKIDLSYTFTESRAISQCVDVSPCDRRPCQHGGTCMPTAEYEYQCLCRDGYDGERCEVVKDTCLYSSQCHNGGSCVNGHCVCAAGHSGVFCKEGQEAIVPEPQWNLEGSGVNDSPIQYAAYFHDDGYLSLPKLMFPRSAPETPETIELEIKTLSADGLILWQGVESLAALILHKSHAHSKASALRKQTPKQELREQGRGKDFISLGLQNGQLVFSYQLGSGEAEILSKERINDGRWHKITAVRTGKQGYIQVDDRTAQHGQSPGRSVMVNTKGSIYLGGAPDMATLTGGKFSSGITGCVRNLSLFNARPGEQPSRPVDLQLHAEDGKNVRRCSS